MEHSSSASDDEEDLHDYDALEEKSLSRTNSRRSASAKKKHRNRDSLSSRGSWRGIKGATGTHGSGKKDSAGKHGRWDLHKRHRNSQRVFKEVGTVLQVLDFGVSPMATEELTDDKTEAAESCEVATTAGGTDVDSALLVEEIEADAMAELGIHNPREVTGSWEQSVGPTLAEVISQQISASLSLGAIDVAPHVMDLIEKGEKDMAMLQKNRGDRSEAHRVATNLLKESLSTMHEIIEEMRECCRDGRTGSSWSSVSSGGSLAAQKDRATLLLLNVLQSLYYEVMESISQVIQWMERQVQNEMVSMAGVEKHCQEIMRVISVVRQLIDLEVLLCIDGIGPARVTKREDLVQKKEENLVSLVRALNGAVIHVQEKHLRQDYLQSADAEINGVRDSEGMQKCWEGLKEVTYRVTSCHPHLRRELCLVYLDTLTFAVHCMASMQDSEEGQRILLSAKAVISLDDDEELCGSDAEVSAQAWLLPCLCKLLSLANELAKRISRSRSFQKDSRNGTDTSILYHLRSAFNDLILISIARMIRLTQCSPITIELDQIRSRLNAGVRMLKLLYKFDSSQLTEKCEEDEWYETFRELTTKLLNNVLFFQTKLQLNDRMGAHVLEHEVSLSSSSELWMAGIKDGGDGMSHFHLVDHSEETSDGRIGTLPIPCESSHRASSLGQISAASSLNMPNPFRDARSGSGGQTMTEFTSTSEVRESPQLPHTNPLEVQNSGRLPCHPLSQTLLSSDESLGTSPAGSCPSMEHFYIIKKNELVYGPRVGSGSTGQVFKMYYRGSPVAVKIMNSPGLIDTQRRLVHESAMHCRLAHHPNVVQFYGQCVGMDDSDHAVGLVMELCDVGSLLEVIREARGIRYLEQQGHDMGRYEKTIGYAFLKNWPLRLKMACDVAAGMEFLHSRDIVHRDLTSYNVVISHGGAHGRIWTAKVCDFERSRHVPPGTTIPRSDTLPNSCAWAAPEVLRNEEYSTQADVFSMGVIVWEILTLELPWRETRDAYHIMALVSNGSRLTLPTSPEHDLSEMPFLAALVENSWKECPEDRFAMRDFHKQLLEIQKALVDRIKKETPLPPSE